MIWWSDPLRSPLRWWCLDEAGWYYFVSLNKGIKLRARHQINQLSAGRPWGFFHPFSQSTIDIQQSSFSLYVMLKNHCSRNYCLSSVYFFSRFCFILRYLYFGEAIESTHFRDSSFQVLEILTGFISSLFCVSTFWECLALSDLGKVFRKIGLQASVYVYVSRKPSSFPWVSSNTYLSLCYHLVVIDMLRYDIKWRGVNKINSSLRNICWYRRRIWEIG